MSLSIDYFLPYQKAWIDESAPLAGGEKSRRIGWTYCHAYRTVQRRLQGLGNYWHSSTDITAAREFIRDCETWAAVFNVVAKTADGEVVIGDEKIATLTMEFSNGRRITAGSSNPKFFRSKGGEVGWDEAAFHDRGRELYKAAQATALFWNYPLRFWSTHNGEGSFFNQLLTLIRGGRMKGKIHRVTILDAVDQGIVEKIRKLKTRDDTARREWLDEMRSTCPDDDVWNEEYMCQPSSDESSLLNYELIRGCESDAMELATSPEQLADGVFYAGFDVGRKRDLSVLWVLQKIGDVYQTRMVRELSQVNYTAQEGLLNVLMGHRGVRRLCIDATGIGNMLAERLVDKWRSRVEAVNFSGPVKSDLAMPLVRIFQDKLLRVPPLDSIREDLHCVRKSVTASGNIRFDAEHSASQDGHADRFWALALAYHAADKAAAPLPAPLLAKPMGW